MYEECRFYIDAWQVTKPVLKESEYVRMSLASLDDVTSPYFFLRDEAPINPHLRDSCSQVDDGEASDDLTGSPTIDENVEKRR